MVFEDEQNEVEEDRIQISITLLVPHLYRMFCLILHLIFQLASTRKTISRVLFSQYWTPQCNRHGHTEQVQGKILNMITVLTHLTYWEMLSEVELFSLEKRKVGSYPCV